jgi:hypothetical protein
MAATPRWKVYRDGKYVASCKYVEDAAALIGMSNCGDIRDGRDSLKVVWREGREAFSAAESYDEVARIVYERAM